MEVVPPSLKRAADTTGGPNHSLSLSPRAPSAVENKLNFQQRQLRTGCQHTVILGPFRDDAIVHKSGQLCSVLESEASFL